MALDLGGWPGVIPREKKKNEETKGLLTHTLADMSCIGDNNCIIGVEIVKAIITVPQVVARPIDVLHPMRSTAPDD